MNFASLLEAADRIASQSSTSFAVARSTSSAGVSAPETLAR
jgi:hypothetical protein